MTELGLTPVRWVLLVAAGALVGADESSWPGAMVSRPLVAATAAGAVAGSPAAGLLAGAVLELMALPYPRMGAARTPDAGVAGVVGGAAFAASGGGTAPLAGAVLAGWVAGWIGELGRRGLRRLNGRLAGRPETLASDAARLERRHRWALRLDLLRGGLVTASLVLPAATVASLARGLLPGGGIPALALGAAAVGAAAGASCRVLSAGRLRPAVLLSGLLAGVGLAALAAA